VAATSVLAAGSFNVQVGTGAAANITIDSTNNTLGGLAEAITRQNGIEVRLPKPADDPAAVPSSVLRYVARTHETVLLDDAAARTPFSTDPYIVARRSRSIFCLPLVKKGKLGNVNSSIGKMRSEESGTTPELFAGISITSPE